MCVGGGQTAAPSEIGPSRYCVSGEPCSSSRKQPSKRSRASASTCQRLRDGLLGEGILSTTQAGIAEDLSAQSNGRGSLCSKMWTLQQNDFGGAFVHAFLHVFTPLP